MKAEYVAGLAVLVTTIGWLITYLTQREHGRELHKFNELLSEHDTRFSHLHQQRAEAIDSLYKAIDYVLAGLQGTVRPIRLLCDPSPEEQRSQAFKHFVTLQDCFYQNRLYFDEDMCEPIEKFLQQCFAAFNRVDMAFSFRQSMTEGAALNRDPAIFAEHRTLMEEASSIILKELPIIQRLIEKKMRHLLGGY